MRFYLCQRASAVPAIDGRLDREPWLSAAWTEDFVDIEGDVRPAPRFRTRAKMLWDDECFYIGAELEEPHVWGTLTEHDSVIFQDNDFEVFIDPDGDNHLYGELELNALNTTWDLLLPKPYRDGGPAINGWEIAGTRTAVWVDGTLNEPADEDRGWSVTIALPWAALKEISGPMAAPPNPGDQWRVNFSRVQWEHEIVDGRYRKVPDKKEDNWVWSPQGVVDMHRPEMWGVIQFGGEPRPLDGAEEREELMRIYHAQRLFRRDQQRWAESFRELGLESPAVLFCMGGRWHAELRGWRVEDDSRLTRLDR